MQITMEQLKAIADKIKEENIYNLRYFKAELDKILGEEYANIYIPLFKYIFEELKIYSDADVKKASDEQLEKIETFINEYEDGRDMNFVYASRM
ncbi:MAG: hypothetical protein N4A40_05255 [Tissierellales bacterium]|jgi:transcriptional/translational regulatory protein YebC/TACO1|nr:hypothetical protein [Tissierellales bacterium]